MSGEPGDADPTPRAGQEADDREASPGGPRVAHPSDKLRGRSPATGASASSGPTRPTSATRARASWSPSPRRSEPTTAARQGAGRRSGASSSGGRWPPTRRSVSASPRRRRSPSSARTPSARAPMPPRRSCASWSWPARPPSSFSLRIAIAIAILLAVVSTSYRQIGYAYPNGGGAYAVGKANLGALRRAHRRGGPARRLHHDRRRRPPPRRSSRSPPRVPALRPGTWRIGVLAIGLITLGNLRGIRESRQHLRRSRPTSSSAAPC